MPMEEERARPKAPRLRLRTNRKFAIRVASMLERVARVVQKRRQKKDGTDQAKIQDACHPPLRIFTDDISRSGLSRLLAV